MESKIAIYQSEDGLVKIDVHLEDDSVWLSQAQIVSLYRSSKANVSEHVKHIFEEGELDKNSVVRNFRTTAKDGKSYKIDFYNLDMIISLGYRIKSKIATKFRIWATSILRKHIIDGYTINKKRLDQLKKDESFKSSLGAIYQTFSKKELYPSIQEKAANLLYLVVKNHSFSDGNKRIAAALFVYFLDKNKALKNKSGQLLIDNNALAATTLMIALSKPQEKEIMCNLVVNFLK